jgi:dihydrolipoamide dehydrogenase
VSLDEDKNITDIIVIGAGPAGVLAALRAAKLSAHTTLVASGEFGGMAANDGPVHVARTPWPA